MKHKISMALCSLIALLTSAAEADENAHSSAHTLTVNGAATLYKPADQLNLSIAVITEADNAEAALQSNNKKMRAVIETLIAKELTHKEYSTGQFNISPIYTPYPKDPPPNWTQKIVGYRVSNSLSIRTGKIDQAGEFIDAANQAGANSIDHISFGLQDERSYRQEIIKAATENAIQDAKGLAAAANLNLGRIRQIWLDNAGTPPHPNLKLAPAAFMERSTPIEAGDVAINANVTIVYEVQ